MRHYVAGIGVALDILANAIFAGDHYATVSCRIGQSIQDGGWASHVPWPPSWRAHFINAVFGTTV